MSWLDIAERRTDRLQRKLHQLTFNRKKQVAFLQDLVNLLQADGMKKEIHGITCNEKNEKK